MNGFRVGEDFSYKAKVEYFCNPGFRLTAGTRLRHCQLNKKWSGTLPICEGNYAWQSHLQQNVPMVCTWLFSKISFQSEDSLITNSNICLQNRDSSLNHMQVCFGWLVGWFNKKSIRSTALYFCLIESVYKDKNKQKMLGLFCEEIVVNCALSYVRHFGKVQTKLAQNISISNVK